MVENKNVSEKLWRLVGCHDVSQDVMDRKVRHYSRDKHEFDRTKKTGTYRTVYPFSLSTKLHTTLARWRRDTSKGSSTKRPRFILKLQTPPILGKVGLTDNGLKAFLAFMTSTDL